MNPIETMEKVKRISPEELHELLDRPDAVVLDVRDKKDWDASDEMIEGAVAENPDHPEEWLDRYSKSCTFILYCETPGEATSARVAQTMKGKGFDRVMVLKGGFKDWQEEDYPTVIK
jgi:rhodanese-related sulfurtransferase